MRGGRHGHVASGLESAIKRWDRYKSDRGDDVALNGLIGGMDDERTVRILKHVTDTHSFDFDVEGAEYGSVRELCDRICRSAQWSCEQLGDAIVRAADVGDVHDALDAVGESRRGDGKTIVERSAEVLRKYRDA